MGLPATVPPSVTEAPAGSLAITSEYTQSQNPPAKPLLHSDARRSLFAVLGRQHLGYFVTQQQMTTAHGLDKTRQGCHLFTSAPAGFCLCLLRSGRCILPVQRHQNPEHPHPARLAQEPRSVGSGSVHAGEAPRPGTEPAGRKSMNKPPLTVRAGGWVGRRGGDGGFLHVKCQEARKLLS